MTSPEQLERETEQARSQIAGTLEELRACLKPGQLVNELADRVGDAGARAFLGNLKRQTIDNPVPVALIGAGFAWLMLGREKARSKAGAIGDRLGNTAKAAAEKIEDEWPSAGDGVAASAATGSNSELSEQAGNLAQNARDRVSSATDRVRQSATDAGNAVRDVAGSVGDSLQRSAATSYQAISDSARNTAAAVADSTRAAGPRTLQAGNALIDFCREQPLVLAGFGLAVGAAIGALLPQTEAENRLLGETSDHVKESAENLVAEQYDAAKTVGERALAAAQDEATRPASEPEPVSYERSPGASVADKATLVPAGHGEDQSQDDQPSPGHAHP
jgi:hypothetical protein